MRQAIARNKQCSIIWEEPDIDKIEDCAKVAEIEEEIMPRAFLVLVVTHWEQVSS